MGRRRKMAKLVTKLVFHEYEHSFIVNHNGEQNVFTRLEGVIMSYDFLSHTDLPDLSRAARGLENIYEEHNFNITKVVNYDSFNEVVATTNEHYWDETVAKEKTEEFSKRFLKTYTRNNMTKRHKYYDKRAKWGECLTIKKGEVKLIQNEGKESCILYQIISLYFEDGY